MGPPHVNGTSECAGNLRCEYDLYLWNFLHVWTGLPLWMRPPCVNGTSTMNVSSMGEQDLHYECVLHVWIGPPLWMCPPCVKGTSTMNVSSMCERDLHYEWVLVFHVRMRPYCMPMPYCVLYMLCRHFTYFSNFAIPLNPSYAVCDLSHVRQYPPSLLFTTFVDFVGYPRYNPQKTCKQWRMRDRWFHWLWG